VCILNKKGIILVSIIVVGFILSTISIILIPDSWDVTGMNEHLKATAPFGFLFGLITPIIFITQFRHRDFYKYVGFFLLFLRFMDLIIRYTYNMDLYPTSLYISHTISLVGYVFFTVYSFKLEGMKKTRSYMIILVIYSLYLHPIIVSVIENLYLSGIPNLLFRMGIPFVLGILSLIYKLILVIHECNVQSTEDVVLS